MTNISQRRGRFEAKTRRNPSGFQVFLTKKRSAFVEIVKIFDFSDTPQDRKIRMAFFLLRAKKYGTDNARFGKMLYNRNGNLRNRKGDDIEIQAEIYGRTAVPCHGGIGFSISVFAIYIGSTSCERNEYTNNFKKMLKNVCIANRYILLSMF